MLSHMIIFFNLNLAKNNLFFNSKLKLFLIYCIGGQSMNKYTNIKTGLTNVEVDNNRNKYGTNKLGNKNSNSFFKLLIESLGDPIIKILLIALAIKVIFLMGASL